MLQRFEAVADGVPTDAFAPNGFGRMFARHVDVADDLVKDVFAGFCLKWKRSEPLFGHFVGRNYLEGAFVHQHKDSAPAGFHHVRCNVMVRSPSAGGNPILSGDELAVEQGQAWICFASIESHGSTPIESGVRVVVSLGGLVEADLAEAAYLALREPTSRNLH